MFLMPATFSLSLCAPFCCSCGCAGWGVIPQLGPCSSLLPSCRGQLQQMGVPSFFLTRRISFWAILSCGSWLVRVFVWSTFGNTTQAGAVSCKWWGPWSHVIMLCHPHELLGHGLPARGIIHPGAHWGDQLQPLQLQAALRWWPLIELSLWWFHQAKGQRCRQTAPFKNHWDI